MIKALKERQDPPCIDLRERFGTKYLISYDPMRRPGTAFDPWLCVIKCRSGAEIYPFGGSTLAVDLDEHRTIRARLKALPCCRPYQGGDFFASFLFDVADFKAVARIVKPYRRRQLTPEQREAAVERLAEARLRLSIVGQTGSI
jgi:hypothetical protein